MSKPASPKSPPNPQTDENQSELFQAFASETAFGPFGSQNEFQMIFLNSSFSDRNLSKEYRTQNPTLVGSCFPSCRTMQSIRPTVSLRKAVSSLKIHSWETGYITRGTMDGENQEENVMEEKVGSNQVEWFQEFSCAGSVFDIKDTLMYNKLLARIRLDDTPGDILQLMMRGVTLFCYNLHYGSTDDHVVIWNRVAQTRRFASHVKDIPFVFFIIPELSYRLPMIGKMKPGLKSVTLKTGTKVIITSDRTYASKCSKKVIYINFRHYVLQLRPPDTLQIGEVSLRVRKVIKVSMECDVLMGGKIFPKMEVHLPTHLRPDVKELSFEEIEDLTFIIGKGINCLLLPLSGNEEYLESIRKALLLLNSNHMKILARVREVEILEQEHANWVAKSYDGIVLVCESCPCSRYPLLESTKYFIKLCYETKKPLILQCSHSQGCLKEASALCQRNGDFEYFFLYPDGYYLPDMESVSNFHLIHQSVEPETVAEVERLALQKFDEPFYDKSSTGSDTMARVIAKMSYQFKAKGILVCSASGRMAMKISHFRPRCPIVVLTKNRDSIRYLKLFHNIRIAFYRELEEAKNIDRADLLVARLLHGLVYGLSLHIFDNNDIIIYCYKNPPDLAYANVAVPFKLDSDTVRRYFDNLTAHLKGPRMSQ